MTPETIVTALIRLTNAIVWTVLIYRYFRSNDRLVARLLYAVILAGMWVLFFGSLASLGVVEGWVARNVYTAFTIFALAIGIGLVSDREVISSRDGPDQSEDVTVHERAEAAVHSEEGLAEIKAQNETLITQGEEAAGVIDDTHERVVDVQGRMKP